MIIKKSEINKDPQLAESARGDRKVMVTELYTQHESLLTATEWKAPDSNQKCSVLQSDNTEIAYFNQHAKQDKHYHKMGTEIYHVISGCMTISVDNNTHTLSPGDTIVVKPDEVHQILSTGQFLSMVITCQCGGASDKYIAD
ncbi:MAG: cupin domain-containing protein [Cyclobacteriaceae bacterium]